MPFAKMGPVVRRERTRLLTAIAAAFLAVTAQAQAQTVTFESAGEPVKTLLPKLAEATHTQLSCEDKCADDVLVLSVANVTPKDLLDRVAIAVDGTWVPKNGALRLTRTTAQTGAEDKAEKQWRTNAISIALAKKREKANGLAAFDTATADRLAARLQDLLTHFSPDDQSSALIQSLNHQGPGARATGRILSTLDPAALADVPLGIKRVFATDPLPSEQSLPAAAVEAARQYVKEQTAWADAAANYKIELPEYNGTRYQVGGLTDETSRPSADLARVLIAITAENWKVFRVELVVADREGEIMSEANDELVLDEAPAPIPTTTEDPLPLPPVFAELIAKRPSRGQREQKLSDAAKAAILKPEQTDPLSIGVGPMLIQTAGLRHENLVAMIGDDQLFAGIQSTTGPTPSAFLTELSNALYVNREADGWMEIHPRLFAKTRRERSNRVSLGNYVRTTAKNPFPGIDVRAKFALELPSPAESFLPATLSGFVRGTPSISFAPALLRFYGSLDDSDKTLAESDQGLPFSHLSGTQLDLLEHLVYGPFSHVSYEGRKQRKVDNSMVHFGGVFRFPTECLPDGISANGTLHIRLSSQSAVYLAAPSGMDTMWTLLPDAFAQAQWDRDHPTQPLSTEEQSLLSDTTEYMVGTRTQYNFSFQLGAGTSEALLEFDDQRDLTTYRYNELPQDFLQKVADALAQIAKRYSGGQPQNRAALK